MQRFSANDNSSQEQIKSLKSLQTETALVKKNLKGQQSRFSVSENGLMNITKTLDLTYHIWDVSKQRTTKRRGRIIISTIFGSNRYGFEKFN